VAGPRLRPEEFDDVDRAVIEATRKAHAAEWELARLLGGIEARGSFRVRGYSGAVHYGDVRGVGPASRVKNLLAIERHFPSLPQVREAFLDGGLSLEKAAALCLVARADDEASWVEAALRLSTPDVQRRVREARIKRGDIPPVQRHVFELRDGDAEAFDQAHAQVCRDEGSAVDKGVALGCISRHYLDCRDKRRRRSHPQGEELPTDPRDLPEGLPGSRYVPAQVARAVWTRDRGCCRVPNCHHRGWVQISHIEERRNGGQPTLENLMLMCAGHNGMHEAGELVIQGNANQPVFLHADGRPFGERPPPKAPP
jgi:hypothetical protein